MMTTYMKSVKQTFINWEKENTTLVWVLVGAIGLPLAIGLAVFSAWLLAIILVLFGLPWNLALVTEFLMIIGGVVGYILSRNKEDGYGV